MPVDAADIWERWSEARREQPDLDPATFAASLATSDEEERQLARGMLETALEVEALRPLSPLVDVSDGAPEPDGKRMPERASAAPDGVAASPGAHSTVREGLVFGPWRILRELGRGGFGIVYEALLVAEPQAPSIALKILNPLSFADPLRQRELLREAAIVGRLHHTHIVRLVDSGVEQGYAWLASERVEGLPLDKLPEVNPAQRAARAITIVRQICDALATAHATGIIHRDLKPANILVDEEGAPHLLDFGLAFEEHASISASHSAGLSGTPIYMAPEQLSGLAPAGPWTDIHALGLLFAVMLVPQTADRLADGRRLLKRMAGRQALARRDLRCLPPGPRAIIARCLEPEPADRYPSAEQLSADLARLERGLAPRHGQPSAPRRALRQARRHPLLATALAALLATPLALVHELWWMAPVPVHFNAILSGKQLLVDGELRGLVPITINLRPGHHTWEMVYQPGDDKSRPYSGTFEVPNRRPSAQVHPLNYWIDTIFVPEDGRLVPGTGAKTKPLPPSQAAWVLLAVRGADRLTKDQEPGITAISSLDAISLTGIPGLGSQNLPQLSTFQLPHGIHTLTVGSVGYRSQSIDLNMDSEEMAVLTVVLEPAAPDIAQGTADLGPWHTLAISGPFDKRLVDKIVELDNLRPFVEYMRATDTTLAMHHPNYFGLVDGTRPGVLGFWLDLPVAVTELEIKPLHVPSLNTSSWARIDLGLSPDVTVPWTGYVHSNSAQDSAGQPDLPPMEPSQATHRKLRDTLAGARRIFVRFTTGPAPSGDAYSYGRALFSYTLPIASDSGDLYWAPALEVRVR